MNEHILLVMERLKDKDSVTQEELEKNERDAFVAADTNYAAYDAAHAVTWAAAYDADDVPYWVDKYFEITGEDRSEYIKELEK